MKKSFALLLLTGCAASALAADLYVTASGRYMGNACYSDIQSAVDAAARNDTVWVEDGFVCDSGIDDDATYGKSRIRIAKTITLRSFSGNATVTVRGTWHDPENGVALGADAVRCIASSSSAILIGFKLEDGATQSGESAATGKQYAGGGLYMSSGYASNCVFTGNAAYEGGGVQTSGTPSFYNCVFTNNTAVIKAGAVNGGGRFYSRSFCRIPRKPAACSTTAGSPTAFSAGTPPKATA